MLYCFAAFPMNDILKIQHALILEYRTCPCSVVHSGVILALKNPKIPFSVCQFDIVLFIYITNDLKTSF